MMIGSASEVDGLYYFDEDSIKSRQAQPVSSNEVSFSAENQIMLWHYRLSQPSFQYLK